MKKALRDVVRESVSQDAVQVMDTVFDLYTEQAMGRSMPRKRRVAAAWVLFEHGFISLWSDAANDKVRVRLATTEQEIAANRRQLREGTIWGGP